MLMSNQLTYLVHAPMSYLTLDLVIAQSEVWSQRVAESERKATSLFN